MKLVLNTSKYLVTHSWYIGLTYHFQGYKGLRAELSLMLSSKPLTKNLVIRIHRLERKYKIKDGNLRAKIAEHQLTIKGLAAQARNKERKINQRVINKKFAEHPNSCQKVAGPSSRGMTRIPPWPSVTLS